MDKTTKTTAEREFSVALLIEDIKSAKDVSDALREVGIIAHVYQTLDNFWVAINTHTPDLGIVDVKCMSQGNLLLRNHPKVKANSMNLCFLYKTSTKVLLNSTQGIPNWGLINLDVELRAQVQTVLYCRNRSMELENENAKLSDRVDRLQKRSTRIMSDVQDSYNFEAQFQKLENMVERLGTFKGSDNFTGRVSTLLETWDECLLYSVYELNQTGQKLISPKLGRPKYKELPDLWLTRECKSGMEPFATQMAEEVAFDIFDSQVRALKITGKNAHPDLLIILSVKEEELVDFQWNWLERYLSGAYAQLALIKTSALEKETHEFTTAECLNYLDDLHFHHATNAHKIFSINLAPMIEWVQNNMANRFFWKAFHNDYTKQISSMLSGSYKVSHYGAHAYVVMIDLKNLEKDFNALKHFVAEFSYWRYFEDSSVVMQQEVVPTLKVLPPSAVSLMRVVQGQAQKVQDNLPLRRMEERQRNLDV